ncbi:hypothetical protein F4804DRAFT_353746 [Jackrogersella minutella]|nr:hypothetical protein F4804DRAFT_353746 [Jackrogersella minutella]
MDNLSDLLEEHISRKGRMFVAFGIGILKLGDYNARDDKANLGIQASGGAREWTMVSIFTDDVIDKDRAMEIFKHLEDDIEKRLSPDQKPERLAFYLEDNSNSAYVAKSYRILGRLCTGDIGQMGVVSVEQDGEKTRPATPQSEMEEAMRKKVYEVEL